MERLAIVGLGYVGLPLAVAFGQQIDTIGFDLNERKLEHYRNGRDPSGEVNAEQLAAATKLQFTSDAAELAQADVIVVVVPTPIDHARQPDLSPLQGACKTVGKYMKPGCTVVFESTVYPGCTEEVCVPILEQCSGMQWAGRTEASATAGEGFYIGYSPERINPGDKEHRLETIVKVVSGDTPETLERLATMYEMVVKAGVHRAASVKVAEAAKVIENTQRDLNIALMNELSLIFDRLDIDTLDVLEAAGTKWNFLPFRPGLVGGHCIGVDPYYLTYRAEAAGHHPQVILAGRHINDDMGRFIAEKTVKSLAKKGKSISGSKVVVLGLTFKEDCPDLRNSRVIDIVHELQEFNCDVLIHDPMAEPDEAYHEYGVQLVPWESLPKADAVVLAVPHRRYKSLTGAELHAILAADGIIMDVKSCLDRGEMEQSEIDIWRL
ncbi:MAG: nucleotide sugar dehydrogenase [Gammaproteobacteria bacterium]|nr:nucleotide sugar dehydrogenase [Gammaproteobacteria bacterium]